LSDITDEFQKYGIVLKKLPDINIDYMPNVDSPSEIASFRKNVLDVYAGSEGEAKKPYCITIAYTGYQAKKGDNQEMRPFIITGGGLLSENIRMPLVDDDDKKHFLWYGINPSEDWFVECYFIKNGGTIADKVKITKDKCTPVQIPGYPIERCDCMDIDVSGLPAENGKIYLTVNTLETFYGGLSFGNVAIVGISTKTWWESKSEPSINETIIHEIGHQLGMVANGTSVDKAQHHYTGKGHRGDHCHNGVCGSKSIYDSTDTLISTCVMFGANNRRRIRSKFCSECAEAVKKMDLSSIPVVTK
jgi:hypothetical protein